MQAQDRFFEMDFRRHVTAGRLSELFGSDAGARDRQGRPHAGLAAGRRAGAGPAARPDDPAVPRRPTPTASTPTSTGQSPAELSLEYAVLGLDHPTTGSSRGRRSTRVAWLKAMAWDLRGNYERRDRPGAHARHGRRREADRRSSTRRTRTPATSRSSTGTATVDRSTPPRPATAGAAEPARRRRPRAPCPRPPPRRRTPLAALAGGARRRCRALLGQRRRHRLQLLGGLRLAHHDRQAAAGQRPAPRRRRSPASGTRWACTADAVGRRARSTSPASPSPGCPAWSSATTTGSPGASPTSAPTSPTSTWRRSPATRYLHDGAAGVPLTTAPGDDQGRRRRTP